MENKKCIELLDEELNNINGGVVVGKEEYATRGSNGVIIITDSQSMNEFNEVDRKIKLNPKDRFTTRVRNVLGRFTGPIFTDIFRLAEVKNINKEFEEK